MGGLAAQTTLKSVGGKVKVTSITCLSGDLIHAMYTAMFTGVQGS